MSFHKLHAKLGNLLRDELRGPSGRADMIDTVLSQFETKPEAVDAVRRLLTGNPALIAPLSTLGLEDADCLSTWVDNLVPRTELSERIHEFCAATFDAAQARLETLGDPAPRIWVRFHLQPAAVPGKHRGRVCVDFRSRSGQPGSHDAMPFETDDLVTLLLRALADLPVDQIVVEESRQPPLRVTPLFRFHPERMRASRHYARNLPMLTVCRGLPAVRKSEWSVIQDALTSAFRTRHMEHTIVEGDGYTETGMQAIHAEGNLVTGYLAYRAAGKEIFDIPAQLTDMMAMSDADDVRVHQIRTPYKAQYVHFGRRADLCIAQGWHCDGAYVFADEGAITVRVVATPDPPEDVMLWSLRSEPTFTFHFLPEDAELDLGTAVDTVIARDHKQLSDEAASAPLKQIEADEAAMDAGAAPGSVRVVTAERVAIQQAVIRERKAVAHRALSLVVNALCYLTAYPDDIVLEWPEETPTALRQRAETGTEKQRSRARTELSALGFTRVHLCGQQFRQQAAPLPTSGGVRPHWRRGHWRQQAHGEGRRLRKLVWIMPILVHAESAPAELPGHIYRPDLPVTDTLDTRPVSVRDA